MSARSRTLLAVLLAACVATTPAVQQSATAASGDTASYVSGGTAVVRAGGQPVVDEGTVVCDDGNGVGVGGMCLAFGGGDAVRVTDELSAENVAFQVCIDNSGDGVCTSPDFENGYCSDVVVFSHDDAGNFYNPVGPVPTGFRAGCAGGPWKGYVVLLCEGAHVASDVHSHPATSGVGEVTDDDGEGLGTFCGGGPQPSRKPYKVGSGARYVSGGTAAARKDGQTVADEGNVVCNNGNNEGVGGFCISFGGGDAVAVYDELSGMDVAFQVCVDNSGDGVCTSPDTRTTCPDRVLFSHDDAGNFFNPIGPLPTGFDGTCAGGPWNGYVVFLCEGTHVSGVNAHTHPATTGTGRVTTGGEGLGTFCGGHAAAPSNKRYSLNPPGTGNDFIGGCSGETSSDPTGGQLGGQNTQTGSARLVVVATDGATPAPTADVTNVSCEVRVNGIARDSFRAPDGIGFTASADALVFSAEPTDEVVLCTNATIDGTPITKCNTSTLVDVPPQEVEDVIDPANDVVDQIVTGFFDPTLCPLLAALAPGVPGVIDVSGEGDVSIGNVLVHDCPPYQE